MKENFMNCTWLMIAILGNNSHFSWFLGWLKSIGLTLGFDIFLIDIEEDNVFLLSLSDLVDSGVFRQQSNGSPEDL